MKWEWMSTSMGRHETRREAVGDHRRCQKWDQQHDSHSHVTNDNHGWRTEDCVPCLLLNVIEWGRCCLFHRPKAWRWNNHLPKISKQHQLKAWAWDHKIDSVMALLWQNYVYVYVFQCVDTGMFDCVMVFCLLLYSSSSSAVDGRVRLVLLLLHFCCCCLAEETGKKKDWWWYMYVCRWWKGMASAQCACLPTPFVRSFVAEQVVVAVAHRLIACFSLVAAFRSFVVTVQQQQMTDWLHEHTFCMLLVFLDAMAIRQFKWSAWVACMNHFWRRVSLARRACLLHIHNMIIIVIKRSTSTTIYQCAMCKHY